MNLAATSERPYALLKRDEKGRLLESFNGKDWEEISDQWIPIEAKIALSKMPKNIVFRMTEDGTVLWDN
jgi:hypothetical protein